jgi:hypothetical protein
MLFKVKTSRGSAAIPFEHVDSISRVEVKAGSPGPIKSSDFTKISTTGGDVYETFETYDNLTARFCVEKQQYVCQMLEDTLEVQSKISKKLMKELE